MTAHRYWRLNITANGGGAYTGLTELELRVAVDGSGTNLATTGNGTASASSEYSVSYVAAYGFDGNLTNRWLSASGGGFPQWLKWDFGAGLEKDIHHLGIKNESNEPSNVKLTTAFLQWSDDNAAWTDFIPVVNHPSTNGATFYYIELKINFPSLAMPMPTVILNNADRYALTLPTPTVDFRAAARFNLSLPVPIVQCYWADRMELAMPSPTVYIAGGIGVANSFDLTLPKPTVSALSGAEARATFSMPALSMSGTTTILIDIEAALPMPTVSMHAVKTEAFNVSVTMPSPTASARGGARIPVALSMPTGSMRGTTGSVISFRAVMPTPTASMTVTAQAFSIIEAVMPMLVAGPYGRIVSMMPMP